MIIIITIPENLYRLLRTMTTTATKPITDHFALFRIIIELSVISGNTEYDRSTERTKTRPNHRNTTRSNLDTKVARTLFRRGADFASMAQPEDKDHVIADLKSWNVLNDVDRMCRDPNRPMTWNEAIKTLLRIIGKSAIRRQPELMYKRDENRAKCLKVVKKLMVAATKDVPVSAEDDDVLIQATVYLIMISREWEDPFVGTQIRCSVNTFYNITENCIDNVCLKYWTNGVVLTLRTGNRNGAAASGEASGETGGEASSDTGRDKERDQAEATDDDGHQNDDNEDGGGGNDGENAGEVNQDEDVEEANEGNNEDGGGGNDGGNAGEVNQDEDIDEANKDDVDDANEGDGDDGDDSQSECSSTEDDLQTLIMKEHSKREGTTEQPTLMSGITNLSMLSCLTMRYHRAPWIAMTLDVNHHDVNMARIIDQNHGLVSNLQKSYEEGSTVTKDAATVMFVRVVSSTKYSEQTHGKFITEGAGGTAPQIRTAINFDRVNAEGRIDPRLTGYGMLDCKALYFRKKDWRNFMSVLGIDYEVDTRVEDDIADATDYEQLTNSTYASR